MTIRITFVAIGLLVGALAACSPPSGLAPLDAHGESHGKAGVEIGLHGGQILRKGEVALELALDSAAEFRAWIEVPGQEVDLTAVQLNVQLDRLDGEVEVVRFTPAGAYLVGDLVIREPHSFQVGVQLEHAGRLYDWSYASFEGRTTIEPAMADKFGLETEPAGSGEIEETLKVFGQVIADPSATVNVRARFPGLIQAMSVGVGARVSRGTILAKVESDESLKTYSIESPAAGFVTVRRGNPGEQTAGRVLYQIVDPGRVWAEFRLFPGKRGAIQAGQSVGVRNAAGQWLGKGVIDWVGLEARKDQSVSVRVPMDNSDGRLVPGMHLSGEILIATHPVDLMVRRTGLQSFREFSVVYAQVGEVYEVRMLELGRQDDTWVEVLGGLKPGTRYVTANSYLVKADIDKDSASHDH